MNFTNAAAASGAALPAGIDLNIVYGGAALADSAAPDAAAAFVKFMAAPENRGAWKDAGFDPLEK